MQVLNAKIVEFILIPPFLLLTGFAGCFVLLWKYPGPNQAPINFDEHKSIELKSIKNSFSIRYVANSKFTSASPYFPAISASCEDKPDAWIQIIRQGDSEKIDGQDSIFYSFEPTFTCSPSYNYNLLSKPVKWVAHTYAVQFVDASDPKIKSVRVIGGFEWGWELKRFNLWPKMIEPKELSIAEWVEDVDFLKIQLAEKSKYVSAKIYDLENYSRLMNSLVL